MKILRKMPSYGHVVAYLLIGAAFLPLICGSSPTVLRLERGVSISGLTNLSHLIQRDRARHGRLLKLSDDGVINYTLGGTGDLSVGLYYTSLQLGTPPRNYYVQVDTGSEVTWIGCVPCPFCPTITGIPNISLHLYNPVTSSTFSPLSCYEERCPTGIRASGSNCSADNPHCLYLIDYADQSHISGFYVQELLTYDRNVGNSETVTSTAPVIFGCATVEIDPSTSSRTDGILGLGQRRESLISQLADQGLSPKVFSHCLSGEKDGGGILVLGEIAEPDIVYSPLIRSQPHYNLELQKISVNGETLPIDPRKLSSSGEQGAIVDSGTTMVYLATEAFDQVYSAINASTTAQSMPPLYEYPCYQVISSVDEAFPALSLHFAGGADLELGPRDYLLYMGLMNGAPLWCIGFQPSDAVEHKTVLGDIVLKNRLFVYDLVGQRIGWTNRHYNCSTGIVKPKKGRRSSAAGISVPLHLVLLILFLISPGFDLFF